MAQPLEALRHHLLPPPEPSGRGVVPALRPPDLPRAAWCRRRSGSTAPSAPSRRPSAAPSSRPARSTCQPLVTQVLIGLNVLAFVFLLSPGRARCRTAAEPPRIDYGLLGAGRVSRFSARSSAWRAASGTAWSPGRSCTPGIIHIGMNMLVLWLVGTQLERVLGPLALPVALRGRAAGRQLRGDALRPGHPHRRRVGRDLRPVRRHGRLPARPAASTSCSRGSAG